MGFAGLPARVFPHGKTQAKVIIHKIDAETPSKRDWCLALSIKYDSTSVIKLLAARRTSNFAKIVAITDMRHRYAA